MVTPERNPSVREREPGREGPATGEIPPDDLIEEMENQASQLQDQAAELEAMNDELSASEARLRGIIDSALDAIIATDSASRILEWNHHAEAVFGWSSEEAMGRTLAETIIPERFRERHRQGIAHYLATGEGPILNRRIEIFALRRSGEEFPVELTVSAARWGSGVVFTSFIRDISERKRAERRLAARAEVTRILATAETRDGAMPLILRAICENLDWELGVHWTVRESGATLHPTSVWLDPESGAAPLETATLETELRRGVGLPGRVWESGSAEWIEDVRGDENFPRREAARSAGIRAAFAFPIVVGRRFLGVMEFFDDRPAAPDEPLLAVMSALGSDVGQFLRRREVETELHERAEWQRYLARVATQLASAAPSYDETLASVASLAVPELADWCSVYTAGEGGEIRRAAVAHSDAGRAAGAEGLAARADKPADAHPVVQVIRTGEPTLIPEIDDALLVSIVDGEEQLQLIRALGLTSAMMVPLEARGRVLGAIVLVSTRASRQYGEDDLEVATDFGGRAAVFLDNARLFRDAQAANETKGDFLATMSHELRTPLNAMLGYTDLLLQGIPEPISEKVAEYVRRVSFSARHLLQLIEEILSYSRLEAGRETVAVEPVDLGSIAEEVRAIVEPLAEKKSLRLDVDVKGTPGPVSTDPRKVRQILLNLVANAVKFTDEGEIGVTASLEGTDLVLTVRDTGIGIAEEHLERIFEPFWQVEQSSTRTAPGTGLGLSVTRRLMALLGGEISVESRPGKGTTFTVRIPVEVEAPGG